MNKKVYVDLSQQDVQDIINAYEKDIEIFNKQKEVLDKIKEYIKEHIRIDDEYPDYMEMLVDEYHQLLELLEEI